MNTQEAVSWIAEIFEEPLERVSADTPREEMPGWDSLGVLNLMAALDERFNIQLSEDEMEAMERVADILAILMRDGALDG
jgi:acyl carrier protein